MEMHYEQAGWARAWHGPKFEALYRVAYFGRLIASRHESNGESCCLGLPQRFTCRKMVPNTMLIITLALFS